eukprot:gene20799-16453_t
MSSGRSGPSGKEAHNAKDRERYAAQYGPPRPRRAPPPAGRAAPPLCLVARDVGYTGCGECFPDGDAARHSRDARAEARSSTPGAPAPKRPCPDARASDEAEEAGAEEEDDDGEAELWGPPKIQHRGVAEGQQRPGDWRCRRFVDAKPTCCVCDCRKGGRSDRFGTWPAEEEQ